MLNPTQLHYYQRLTPEGYEDFQPTELDFGTVYLINEAESLGISCEIIPGTDCIELTYQGKKGHLFIRSSSHQSALAFEMCRHKEKTKALLRRAGISVSPGYFVHSSDSTEYLKNVFNSLKKPLFVKPSHASHGDGATAGVDTFDGLTSALQKAFEARSYPQAGAMIEEIFQQGEEYCLYVSAKSGLLAAMKRIPANVVGDGNSTLAQLIAKKNEDPRRLDLPGALFRKIEIDDDVMTNLTELNLTLESVPRFNEHIFLRKVSNLSQGGDGLDVTDEVHESVKEIAHRAVLAVPDLPFAGLDFMTHDISKAQTPESYVVIEVNSCAELAIHDDPILGKKRNTCRAVLEDVFPELRAR